MATKHHNTASLLWLLGLIGLCGLHRIYLDRKVTGVIWLLTFGLYGLGQVYDMFVLKGMVSESNTKLLTKVKPYVPIYFNYAPTFNRPYPDPPVATVHVCDYCGSQRAKERCETCGATG